MKYKILKKSTKEELKIPKGYILIEDYELMKLFRTDEKLKQLAINDSIWCNTFQGVRALWLDLGVDWFGVLAGGYLERHARGVVVKSEEKND